MPNEAPHISEGIGSMTADQIIDVSRSRVDSGEKRLVLEVLAEAIKMVKGEAEYIQGRRKLIAMREAGEWIAGKPAAAWKLDFNTCCEFLDIEPAYLRRGIMRNIQPFKRRRAPMRNDLKMGTRKH